MTDGERLAAASPAGLAALLGAGLSPAAVARVAAVPRLRARLLGAAASRLGSLDAVGAPARLALSLRPDGLADLALAAGAVWHAGPIARTVAAPERSALIALIGPAAYGHALAGRGLAPPGVADAPDLDSFGAAVRAAGEACFAAWCTLQPPAVAARLRLVLPAGAPAAAHRAWGPAIVERLLAA